MANKKGKPKSRSSTGPKRAAIYIRVSSEKQGEKVSPEAQEADARVLCEQQAYSIIDVYRDTEKYRVGKRLVEPSGTRADRPHFRQMLADADAGRFDVIIAWREDRLYRGVNRAMLEVSERVQNDVIAVELVKEHYDAATAVVKAWAAGVELKAKQDRMQMGVAGRFKRGKDWNSIAPYGYKRIDGIYKVEESEAVWVAKMFHWFGDGITGREIRDRLIGGGAPQRFGGKHVWSVQSIYHILKRDFYHSGFITRSWGGEVYQLPLPAIVTSEAAQKVIDRFARWKAYPAGNLRDKVLAAGLVHCKTCGNRMIVISGHKHYIYYSCTTRNNICRAPTGCASTVRAARLDGEIFEKVWKLFSDAVEFEQTVQARIAELQARAAATAVDCSKLESDLNDLALQRQWVITQTRLKKITQADMDTQLATLTWLEASIRYELSQAQLLSDDRISRLIAVAENFRQEVTRGSELLALTDRTPEQEQAVFRFKHKIVQGLVTQVDVLPDKSTEVHTEFDLTEVPDPALQDQSALVCKR